MTSIATERAVKATVAANSAGKISLQGWDTANVITMDVLNKVIKQNHKSPPTFSYTDAGSGCTMSGTWGDWVVVADPNRTGGTVVFNCPVTTGSGTDMMGRTHDLTGAEMQIEVTLATHSMPSATIKDATGTVVPGKTEAQALKTDMTSTPLSFPVQVSGFTPAGLQLPFQILFQDWFNSNFGVFDPIFHIALIDVQAKDSAFQWLKPVALSYATVVDASGDGVFAALCETDVDNSAKLAHQVDAGLCSDFPTGTNSILVISGEKFCEHILKVGAQHVLDGSQLADFDVIGDGLVVTNNKELAWRNLVLTDGTPITPKIPKGQFTMTVVEDMIELQFVGMTFLHPLFVGNDIFTLTFTQYVHIEVGKNANGQLCLFPTNKDPSDATSKDVPDIKNLSVDVKMDPAAADFDSTMEMLSIVLSVLPLGLGLFKAGAWLVKETPAALKLIGELSGVISKDPAIFTAAIDAADTSQLSEEAVTGIDNLAAGAVIAKGIPADSGLATILNRFALGMGFLSAMCQVFKYVNTMDHNGDVSFDDMPALDDFMANVLGTAQWPGAKNWELKDARLAESLLLYGECTI